MGPAAATRAVLVGAPLVATAWAGGGRAGKLPLTKSTTFLTHIATPSATRSTKPGGVPRRCMLDTSPPSQYSRTIP